MLTDEQAAKDIWDRQQAHALAGAYTDKAQATGRQRSQRLGDRVIEQFTREDLLSVFQEPDFQALLTKAQIGAAQTDEETDYDVLANMLADRARNGNIRSRRIGLDRAIEVADKVDLLALKVLTCLFLYVQIRPIGTSVFGSIAAHDQTYGRVMDGEPFPDGAELMDHLDLLNLGRVNTLGSYKKFDDYWLPSVSGWYALGVERSDPNLQDAWEGFARRGCDLPADVPLISHELDESRLRLAYANPTLFRRHLESLDRFEDRQIDALLNFAASTWGLHETGHLPYKSALSDHIKQLPTLGPFRAWLEGLSGHLTLTAAGRTLARAYAEHCGVSDSVQDWTLLKH